MRWETLWEMFWGGFMICVVVFGLVYSLMKKGRLCPWGCPACRRCAQYHTKLKVKEEGMK